MQLLWLVTTVIMHGNIISVWIPMTWHCSETSSPPLLTFLPKPLARALAFPTWACQHHHPSPWAWQHHYLSAPSQQKTLLSSSGPCDMAWFVAPTRMWHTTSITQYIVIHIRVHMVCHGNHSMQIIMWQLPSMKQECLCKPQRKVVLGWVSMLQCQLRECIATHLGLNCQGTFLWHGVRTFKEINLHPSTFKEINLHPSSYL